MGVEPRLYGLPRTPYRRSSRNSSSTHLDEYGQEEGPELHYALAPLMCVLVISLSASSLEDRLHLVVIVGAKRIRPEIAR